ncbi:hypothetical protein NDI45_21175 [Leptolyngbya sp. GB1-A1]
MTQKREPACSKVIALLTLSFRAAAKQHKKGRSEEALLHPSNSPPVFTS